MRAPLENSIIKITATAHIVMDIFGSIMSNAQTAPPASRTAITPRNLLISVLEAISASIITIKNLAYSEGCIVKKPRFIQRFAP